MRKHIDWAELILNILVTISIILFVWFAISTIEVWTQNIRPNPEYNPLNLWTMLINK